MPKIVELKTIDGRLAVFLDMPDSDEGSVTLLSEAEKSALDDTISSLRQEVETLREALLRRVQEDNACQFSGKWMRHSRPIGGPPCGPEGGSWNSQKCGCAEEARALLPKDKP